MTPGQFILAAVLAYWLVAWCLPAWLSLRRDSRGERRARAAHPSHGVARVPVGRQG